MEFKVYQNKNKPVFLYIHAECLSSFSFKEEVKELKKDFTVILPVLPGHDCCAEQSFESIDQCADEIIAYIDQHYQGHIQVLSGFSMGGQIAVSILSKRNDISDYALIDSAMMQPVKIKNWSAYASVYLPALAKQKWFNKFMYYTIFNDDFAYQEYYHNYQVMQTKNLRQVLEATTSYQMPNNLSHVTCKVAIMVGQREKKAMKHSANMLKEAIPDAEIFMLMNYTHGDFSVGNPNEYIRFVKSWIQNKDIHVRKKVEKIKQQQEGEYMPNWKHILLKMKAKKNA